MNLLKTKRVKLKGKAAKEFYNAIYERDGGTCVWCGAPIEYGVKHHHEPCGIYKSDEIEKAVMLCLTVTTDDTLKIRPRGKRYAVNIFKTYTVTRAQRENEPVEMDQNRRQICLK